MLKVSNHFVGDYSKRVKIVPLSIGKFFFFFLEGKFEKLSSPDSNISLWGKQMLWINHFYLHQ